MNVTCTKCNWVSFAVTKAAADEQKENFLRYYDSLSPAQQQDYYNGKRQAFHYTCLVCGGDQFRPSTEEELKNIYGCTINPVVWEDPAPTHSGLADTQKGKGTK